jgi:hypothetical protein
VTATWDVEFTEVAAQRRVASVPLAHLSVELGHLYFEEFAGGTALLRRHFAQVQPWLGATVQSCERGLAPGRRPRISTCFLIDDYFTRFSSPAEVIPQLVGAAAAEGVTIDYVARESGCAYSGKLPLAELVFSRLVAEPVRGTTGGRPPTSVTGWLFNGERSLRAGNNEAMRADGGGWRPPAQNGALNHSIFLDVELWDEQGGRRRWACPFLAAVWHLIRLGVLRYHGEPVVSPVRVIDFPTDWDDLPPVVQISDRAQPFSAYRAVSILDRRFLSIEHAVGSILQQVSVDPAVAAQIRDRSMAEHIELPDEMWQRISYVFA